AVDRAVEGDGGEARGRQRSRMVPCGTERFSQGMLAQFVGAARRQPDLGAGGADAASFGQALDEGALASGAAGAESGGRLPTAASSSPDSRLSDETSSRIVSSSSPRARPSAMASSI